MNNLDAQVNMVKQQLRTADILEEQVLDLFEKISREDFVPETMRQFAYSDMQIPLAHAQRMMTPIEEGTLLQTLALKGNETVLEVGTGSGYLTALLSQQAKKVISVDYYAEFTETAKQKLAKHNIQNVELITGDANNGWLELAPYEIIIVSGAIESISDTLKLQVLNGGKLFAIVGQDPIMRGMMLTLNAEQEWEEELIFETNLPPLINKFKMNKFVF